VCDPHERVTAIEGTKDLCEDARPDQPLGPEDQLLPATAQRRARLLAERNHDVSEAVQEVELVDERRCPASLELSVQRERALPLGEHAEVWRHYVVVGEAVQGEEIRIGLLG